MPNIPTNPIPSGLPAKHNYLRKAATTPTDFNPLDIILNTTSHSIDSPLGQRYIYTYDFGSITGDFTTYLLVDTNNSNPTDYINDVQAFEDAFDNIFETEYNGNTNNILSYKEYNLKYLCKQKAIYFLDSNNQIIYSKVLDDGSIYIYADATGKELIPNIYFNEYSNIKANNTTVSIGLLIDEDISVDGAPAIWGINGPGEILTNTNKVVLYDIQKPLRGQNTNDR